MIIIIYSVAQTMLYLFMYAMFISAKSSGTNDVVEYGKIKNKRRKEDRNEVFYTVR